MKQQSRGTGLDSVAQCAMRPLNSHLNTPRIDSYRFSMANLEDSQETELDAILGELCALETQCDQALSANAAARRQQQLQPKAAAGEPAPARQPPPPPPPPPQPRMTHSRSSSDGARANPDGDDGGREHVMRTDSPDNDSAFSDNVSMLSSESSASSGGSGGRAVAASGAADPGKVGQPVSPTSQMDVASRAKAEKIKIALEKMREASVKKLFIKAFGGDGSSKSLLVDESMTAGHVARLLADKNHTAMDPCWAVVEHLPELHMERAYEDHELLVENLLMWTRDSKNKLLFVERPEKVALFTGPELFLLPPGQRGCAQSDFDDHSRTLLLEEFFSGGAGVPEVEGPLFLKSDSKKGWKRHHFVLRASGLYYLPKEKARGGGGGSSARDLAHLASFDVNQVYYGVGWRKKYKAPTDFCFAIKHPRLQQPKSTKYIKFLCAEDEASLHRWVVGIRLAKFGRQLMDNYRALVDELAQDDLDQLAQARSCSVSSIAPTLGGGGGARSGGTGGAGSPSDSPGGGGGTAADAVSTGSSSSGCLSDGCCGSAAGSGGTASTLSGNTAAAGFECDFPTTGTIKRKPSVNPKLPLTSITRQLKEVGETVACTPSTPSPSTAATTPTSVFSPSVDLADSVNVNVGTVQRAGSVRRRRSCQTPSTPDGGGGGGGADGGSNSSTLKRHHSVGGGSARSSASASSSSSSTPVREPPPPLAVPPEPEVEEELPPPPPDMFESTLSLDSLPPPPPPQPAELSGSRLSLASLPPPPPPYRPPPPAPTPAPPSDASAPTDCTSPTRRGPLAAPPPVYSAPPYLAELKAAGGGPCGQPGSPLASRRPGSPPPPTPPPATPRSPVPLAETQQRSRTAGKKISFAIPAESPGADGTRSLPPPASRKPPPPRRSESTRLTTLPAPQQLAPPPKDFLKDLQRVMKKKWQVAQKCKADLSTTPHEVLGFRDAPPPPLPPPDVRRENSVLDWVQEHYGGGGPHQYNLYENVYLVGGGGSPAHAPPPGPPAVNGQHYPPYRHHAHPQHPDGAPPPTAVDYRAGPAPGSRLSRQNSVAAAIAAKKRPPPPPPKRSETTQLTTTAVPPHARAPLPPPPAAAPLALTPPPRPVELRPRPSPRPPPPPLRTHLTAGGVAPGSREVRTSEGRPSLRLRSSATVTNRTSRRSSYAAVTVVFR
ncbi:ras-associated and pleckstrin homology domains-containing protein 1 isoform X4 [Schistocerca gregaria]|uniref:ras-associated and pleckstrin homology domains-containing protein 1 isoform X4 n=1 Tax=Schistocerca gregaria TaxID=7010 RepID=UPI00211EBA22|nr:ras-associated and pleckstrin homology domains-containing protein 1 isoform X4 [Schistocerca gregaria]